MSTNVQAKRDEVHPVAIITRLGYLFCMVCADKRGLLDYAFTPIMSDSAPHNHDMCDGCSIDVSEVR